MRIKNKIKNPNNNKIHNKQKKNIILLLYQLLYLKLSNKNTQILQFLLGFKKPMKFNNLKNN